MTVMIVSEVAGQSAQGYDGMLATVGDALRQAPGFIMHASHRADDGWRIVEVWASREDASRSADCRRRTGRCGSRRSIDAPRRAGSSCTGTLTPLSAA